MNYYQLLSEKQRLQNAIKTTKSAFTKRDYNKCLIRVNERIKCLERN